jgi:light-regulated signal transduction histidine kinase (bacteriophytochrome)
MSIDLASELRVMVGNAPATRSYVTDLYTRAADEIEALRARLEKAEAERDALKALAERQLGQMIEKAAQARNDALEEAAKAVEDHSQVGTRSDVAMAAYSNAANAVRNLKDKS